MLRLLTIGFGAVLVGALVWFSVAADAIQLVAVTGWWSLVVLAFPAFMGFAVWRGWGD